MNCNPIPYKNYKRLHRKHTVKKHDVIIKNPVIKIFSAGAFFDIIDNNIFRMIDILRDKKIKMTGTVDNFPYQHIACFRMDVPISIGENSTREAWCGANFGRHAEMDAIRRLPRRMPRSKQKYIDLIVIRIDLQGNLKNSKPCSKCIEYMSRLPSKSYRVEYVYYSDSNGNIIKVKFSKLMLCDDVHISRRFKELSNKSIN